MKRKRTRVKRRVKFMFGFFAVAVIILIIVIFNMRVHRGIIETGSMEFVQNQIEVVIARDEIAVTTESYGRIMYTAQEGQSVTADEKIAEVYKAGYNDNIFIELVRLQQSIKDYQSNTLRKDISDAKYDEYETQIQQLLQDVASAMQQNNSFHALEIENELRELLKERREYLLTFQADGTLNELLEQESAYMTALAEMRSEITAKQDGIISFTSDGYESLLNKMSLEQLSYNDVKYVKSKNQNANTMDSTVNERVLYRIINPDVFYVIVNTNAFPMVLNEIYQVSFSGFYDKAYNGKVVFVNQGKQGSVFVLEVNDSVRPFTDMRTSKVNLAANFSGLQVPISAVSYSADGIPGIKIDRGDAIEFIPIEIMAQDKNNVLFKNESGQLSSGMNYIETVKGKTNNENDNTATATNSS